MEQLLEEAASVKRRFRRYETYRDSGVEWLGEIPAHWGTTRLKHGTDKIGSGKTPSGGVEAYVDEGVMFLRSQNVHFTGLRLEDVAFIDAETDAEMRGSRVREGDVLLNITGASLGRCCVARLSGRRANVNQHVCVLRPRRSQFASAFVAAAIASRPGQAQILNSENGVSRDALNYEQVGDLSVPRPPLDEQRAIAAFLDRETARIDPLVAKKERLVELLLEKRTALITHAVTKGLDPTVPMKESGVEWLGEIPVHWQVTRSKNLFRLRNVRALPGESQLTASQQYGVIPQSDFMAREGRRVVQVITGAEILKHVEAKDFVISMRSFQGGIEWSPFCGAISSAYVVLAPSEQVWHPFFVHLFKSRRYIQALQSTSDLVRDGQALRFENFVQVPLPVVPPEEQQAIAGFLDRETARLDALITKVRDAIDRLKELRIALISAAVTGKIDVREEAA